MLTIEQIAVLIEITRFELNCLQKLFETTTEIVPNYALNNSGSVFGSLKDLHNEQQKFLEFTTTVNDLKSKPVFSFFKTNDTVLRHINKEIGLSRANIEKALVSLLINMQQQAKQNWQDEKVKKAHLEIQEAMSLSGAQHSYEIIDVSTKLKLSEFKSIPRKCLLLQNQYLLDVQKLASFIMPELDSEYEIARNIYFKQMDVVISTMIHLMQLVTKYHKTAICQLLYECVPWFNHLAQERETKITDLQHSLPSLVKELCKKTSKPEPILIDKVKQVQDKLTKASDFELYKAYNSALKGSSLRYQNTTIRFVLEHLSITEKKRIKAINHLLERYNTATNPPEINQISNDVYQVLILMDEVLRKHIHVLINRDYQNIFKKMLIDFPQITAILKPTPTHETVETHHAQNLTVITALKILINNLLDQGRLTHSELILIRPLTQQLIRIIIESQKMKTEKILIQVHEALNVWFELLSTAFHKGELLTSQSAIWDFIEKLSNIDPSLTEFSTKTAEYKKWCAWPLNQDISFQIFNKLPEDPLFQLPKVCKNFKTLMQDFWQKKYTGEQKTKGAQFFLRRYAVAQLNAYLALYKKYYKRFVFNSSDNPNDHTLHLHSFEFSADDIGIHSRVTNDLDAHYGRLITDTLKEEIANCRFMKCELLESTMYLIYFAVKVISIDLRILKKLMVDLEKSYQNAEQQQSHLKANCLKSQNQ